MRKKNIELTSEKVKTIYRHASVNDLEKWRVARSREQKTMHKSREIASKLGLDMKIGDVEFQADNIKAIFYYTSEGRVDFRELIKQMASEFHVRIEMCQIGVRQEAQRMGGIGSCGRELCCSTWLNDFRSVSTSAARYQQLSLNPQKLAGQCGKLKCCLNYELDMYVEAIKDFPGSNLKLKTKNGMAFLQKTDIFRRKVWYSYTSSPSTFIELNLDDVQEIIRQNKEEKFPESLEMYVAKVYEVAKPDYENVVGQDSITRFDKDKSSKNRKKSKSKSHKSNHIKFNSNNPSSKTKEKSDKSANRKVLNQGKVNYNAKSQHKNL
jgi:cell fate regulator YaaT (PSP1 superfamily)